MGEGREWQPEAGGLGILGLEAKNSGNNYIFSIICFVNDYNNV